MRESEELVSALRRCMLDLERERDLYRLSASRADAVFQAFLTQAIGTRKPKLTLNRRMA